MGSRMQCTSAIESCAAQASTHAIDAARTYNKPYGHVSDGGDRRMMEEGK